MHFAPGYEAWRSECVRHVRAVVEVLGSGKDAVVIEVAARRRRLWALLDADGAAVVAHVDHDDAEVSIPGWPV